MRGEREFRANPTIGENHLAPITVASNPRLLPKFCKNAIPCLNASLFSTDKTFSCALWESKFKRYLLN